MFVGSTYRINLVETFHFNKWKLLIINGFVTMALPAIAGAVLAFNHLNSKRRDPKQYLKLFLFLFLLDSLVVFLLEGLFGPPQLGDKEPL